LPEGESPPSTNFNAACKKLDIKGWNVQRVADAFRRSYPRARDEYEGRKPPPTVEQEAIRRAAAGKERGWETPLEALAQFALWLEQQPVRVRQEKSGPESYDR
jgi:predicted alpha/beta-hydrolase family hydrolase